MNFCPEGRTPGTVGFRSIKKAGDAKGRKSPRVCGREGGNKKGKLLAEMCTWNHHCIIRGAAQE